MRKLLPVLLAVIGVGLGGGAGYFLRPAGENPVAVECPETPCPEDRNSEAPHDAATSGGEGAPPSVQETEFVKLNNQFIVPDIRNGAITSLVVLSLSLEVSKGSTENVFALEPKLRDTFLQVLFDHANSGGFRGDFTSSSKMDDLRRSLLEAARSVLGSDARSVLISDIVRQDMT